VATEWAVFSEQDPASIAQLTKGRLVIDGRNCLDREAWKKSGFRYRGMGRS
jgi:UDPglucose 6-dehydrogenase